MDKKSVQNVSAEMIQKIMESLNVAKSPDAIPEQPASGTKMAAVGKSLGNLLKAAAPTLASFIPGVGPIASQLLSTLNDDEWYEGFKTGGASFNDLLITEVRAGVTGTGMPGTANPVIVKPRGAIAAYGVDINTNAVVWDEVMPQMLAYIRSKTNNVLIDVVSNYKDAAIAGSRLFAIYYSISKYIALAEKLPINIPSITTPLQIIAPQHLNQLIGIRDSLKSYLQSSIRLPYAWTEMLRWRFGTMFLSANTGQPGLITYDPFQPSTGHRVGASFNYQPTWLTDYIEDLKTVIIGLGRAAADLKLAFDNHQIRWDVDERHYDEKEYVLRNNLTIQGEPRWDATDVCSIVMDSRLNNGAASQASLLSTILTVGASGNYEYSTADLLPLVVWDAFIFHFAVYSDVADRSVEAWLANAILGLSQSGDVTPKWIATQIDTLAGGVGIQVVGYLADGSGNAIPCFGPGEAYKGPGESTRSRYASQQFSNHIRTALQSSLRINDAGKYIPIYLKNDSGVDIDGLSDGGSAFGVISMDQVTYDRALISADQVKTLQRTALRNLFRGDYNAKVANTEVVSEVKQATTEVVKALV